MAGNANTEAERAAKQAERVVQKARAVMAEGNDGPSPEFLAAMAPFTESAKPAKVTRPAQRTPNDGGVMDAHVAKYADPAPADGPSKEFTEAMAPLMREIENTPSTPLERSVARITYAIPGEIFGAFKQFNQQIREGYLYESQYNAFMRAGEVLKEELIKNKELRHHYQTSAGSGKAGLLDLDNNGAITPQEYAAVAAAIDEKRTAGKDHTLASIAKDLGNALELQRARQILHAMEDVRSADFDPVFHRATAPESPDRSR